MASAFGFVKRLYQLSNPPSGAKTASETEPKLRFGILGAAAIAPTALVIPAQSHPEVEVYAVAARDHTRATAYAKKWKISKVHNDYQSLLDDANVDIVYNPLPNGLHFEWTMKALEKGKHVLLEKPAANTADETRQMFELAERKGLILMEAFHYRFHPAVQRTKAIPDGGELGKIKQVSTSLKLPQGFFPPTDIRFKYELGGGSLMDVGCYTLSAARYFASSDPLDIISAQHEVYMPPNAPVGFVPNVDRGMRVKLAMPKDITAALDGDLGNPRLFGIIPRMPDVLASIECEHGKVELFNFVGPMLYHTITVTCVDEQGKKTVRKEKAYVFSEDSSACNKGEEWWSTYRYQLEAFVDKVKGREPQMWITKEDSIANMEWVEKIYTETGLGPRPRSSYVHSAS
ncbi:hypothetical protein BKA70DRAFT_1501647 [Coprinopsis sp. MPI-PUGE-AT-0042]|nr:hypothetical protein BKA70DRAFT_1501647 [Coprinopsis sp. MPI-PUGE-AT-0042]